MQYCHIPLQVIKNCLLRRKLYMSKDHPSHQHTIQGRENIQMSSLPNKTVRKDNLTSHRRVHTSELALNRKQNASVLNYQRINFPIET